MFPVTRMRRNRSSEYLRSLVSETEIRSGKLVMPVFIDENLKEDREIRSMPGIMRYAPDSLGEYAEHLSSLGVKNVLLFGIPSSKDEKGSSAYDENGVAQNAIRSFRNAFKGNVIADLCLCEYTSHGHCGLIKDNYVDNDSTLDVYGMIAQSYARAGVDIIAPSGMMDGQVSAIRSALDEGGFHNLPIMAYSAKYSSVLYTPFRDAADSAPSSGDRKSHQMDPRNWKEALREIDLDISEGADIVMVKPAMFYLDVLARAREAFDVPLAAYSVSAEYTMLKKAVDLGDLPESAITEYIGSVFRAGADIVITYFAEYILGRNSLK